MAQITITVSAEDLANGSRINAWSDPIALAMVRAFGVQPTDWQPGGYRWPFVWARVATLPDLTRVRLPNEVWRKVESHAAGKTVEPYSFELEVPDHLAPKPKRRQRRRELAHA